jgi:ComF family protein
MLLNDLLSLFYPRLCLICRQSLIDFEQHVCLHCLCNNLPYARYHKRPDNPALKLYAGIPQIREVAAFLIYEKDSYVQKLVHDFKYRDNSSLAEYMGQLAAYRMKADGLFRDVDFLTPVPLHPKKERQRGYNQSLRIARGMASGYGIPICDKVLYRKIYTTSQTRKSVYERHLNIENVFDTKNGHLFAGKHVLLVDDVITTGATSIACIEALTAAIPDIRISVFSLAMVTR